MEECIDQNIACGIDISLGLGGLLDHIVFVYGYDDTHLYVADTHETQALGYEAMPTAPFLFKLAKTEIEKRWTRFGRVWVVKEYR